jgi:archaellum biogenesis ATPase FlaH
MTVVDSFSYLTFDLGAAAFRSVLRDFRKACRERGRIVLLTVDRGMLSDAFAALVGHSADHVVSFEIKEAPDGVLRYLRLPKAAGGSGLDRNIHYAFDGRRIAVDLRNRIL